jgi:CRP/FNR family transcriptional regulator, cyclic AMP receptor protein
LQNESNMQATTLADALRKTYLMSGLAPEQVEKVASIAQNRQFEGGDMIVRQFSKDTDLILVLEGSARINSFSGELIAEAGAGSIIGEMSLVDEKPRSATVVAIGNVKAAIIPAPELWKLMKEDAHVARIILLNIARVLSARLRAANIQADLGVHR